MTPNPSLPVQTLQRFLDFLKMRGRLCVMATDWKRVRRTDAPMNDEEKEEIAKRLNRYVEQHRSLNADSFVEEKDWDYRKEE